MRGGTCVWYDWGVDESLVDVARDLRNKVIKKGQQLSH